MRLRKLAVLSACLLLCSLGLATQLHAAVAGPGSTSADAEADRHSPRGRAGDGQKAPRGRGGDGQKRKRCLRRKRDGRAARPRGRACRSKRTEPARLEEVGVQTTRVVSPAPDAAAEAEPEEGSQPPAPERPPLSLAPQPPEPLLEPGEGAPAFRFFAPTSIWNAPVPAEAPLDLSSAALVGAFEEMVTSELWAGKGPSINTTEYSVPIYTVPADQPTVQVKLSARYAVPALRSAWSAVPLPPNALPSAGNDRHLVVWQPETDRLWEFWHLRQEGGGWQAEWGGAMAGASASSGVYDEAAWPGATDHWGASACSLSIAGGLITFEDLERGSIDHALAMAVSNVRGGVYAEPARRTDGRSSDPLSLPEGAHLRLDPSLDLDGMNLPRLTRIVAEAAQRYGIIVRDGARNVTLYAQDPTPLGTNPYKGPDGYWEGSYPQQFLSSFPWEHLQLLEMTLHEYR